MDLQTLSLVLNALQTFAIVVSLGIVVYQLRQFNQSYRQDTYTKLADHFIRMNESVLCKRPLADQIQQHNTVYLKLSDDQKDLYNGLLQVFLFYEALYVLFSLKGVDCDTWESCEIWLEKDILSLDLFETFWKIEKTTYHKGMYKHIDEKLRKLKIAQKTDP